MTTVPPTQPGSTKLHGPPAQVVQIMSLPDALKTVSRPVRIEGEVIGQNRDGTTRVRTEQGNVDILVRGRQPQEGQRIEIDVQAGSPPRSASIRPAPAQPQPTPQTPPAQPPPTQAPPPQAQTPPPVQGQAPTAHPPVQPPAQGGLPPPASSTPPAQGQAAPPATAPPDADGIAQPYSPHLAQGATAAQTTVPDTAPTTATAQTVKAAAPLPPLTPGQIVRLVPLGAALQGTATPPLQTAGGMMPPIVPKGEGTLLGTLINAVKTLLPQAAAGGTDSPLAATPKAAPGTAAAVPQDLALPPAIVRQPLILPAKIMSLTLPSGQTPGTPQPSPLTGTAAQPAPAMPGTPGTAATQTSAPLLTVTVTQTTQAQQPVIALPMNDKGAVANFVLQSPPAAVPVGTQIVLQPQAPLTPQVPQGVQAPAPQSPAATILPAPVQGPLQVSPALSAMPPAWRALLPPMQSSTLWPVMDDLFQTFYQATPQAAQILGRIIPSPANGANFGPAVLLFAAALKAGDIQGWMGEKKLEMLQKLGKGPLLSRLSGETAAAANNDAPATEWKSFPVPLLWQNEISKIMFHVRQEPPDQDQQEGDGGTRFIMDLSLTRMGEVQIDGIVRANQLNLILRTQSPVSLSMQDAMRVAYADALDGTQIYGDIGFQSDVSQWQNVLKRQDVLKGSV